MTQNQFQFTRKQFNCFKNHKYLLNMWINMSSYCYFWVFFVRVWMDIFRLLRVVRMNSPNICVLNMRHVNGTNSWITKSRKVDSFGFRVTPKGHFYILQLKFSVIWGHSRSNLFTLTAMIELTAGSGGSENPCYPSQCKFEGEQLKFFQVQEIINVNILNNYK